MSKLKLEHKAGLQISVHTINKILANELQLFNVSYALLLSKEIQISVASVIEYIIAEILELAGNATRDKRKIRISSEFIIKAIKLDPELNNVFNSNSDIQLNKPADDTIKLHTWTYIILKQVHPDTQISTDASRFLDKLIYDLIKKIAAEFPNDIKDLDLSKIIDKVLMGELAKHANREAQKSLNKYLVG